MIPQNERPTQEAENTVEPPLSNDRLVHYLRGWDLHIEWPMASGFEECDPDPQIQPLDDDSLEEVAQNVSTEENASPGAHVYYTKGVLEAREPSEMPEVVKNEGPDYG